MMGMVEAINSGKQDGIFSGWWLMILFHIVVVIIVVPILVIIISIIAVMDNPINNIPINHC